MAKSLCQARDAERMAEFPTESKRLISLKRVRAGAPSPWSGRARFDETPPGRRLWGSVPQVGWGSFPRNDVSRWVGFVPRTCARRGAHFCLVMAINIGYEPSCSLVFLVTFLATLRFIVDAIACLPACYSVVIGGHHGANGPSPLGSGGVADRAAISNLCHYRRHADSLGRIRIHLAHVVAQPRERGDAPL